MGRGIRGLESLSSPIKFTDQQNANRTNDQMANQGGAVLCPHRWVLRYQHDTRYQTGEANYGQVDSREERKRHPCDPQQLFHAAILLLFR
jgi:hypothetical protein